MKTFRQIKKIVIAAIGFIVLISGIILIVLPGPASLVIPAGLAILATEFVWARNLLDKIKSKIGRPRQGVDIN
ncbi:MAG: PGPGW domain-containing protein [Ignavibacteriaceae bacterium]